MSLIAWSYTESKSCYILNRNMQRRTTKWTFDCSVKRILTAIKWILTAIERILTAFKRISTAHCLVPSLVLLDL